MEKISQGLLHAAGSGASAQSSGRNSGNISSEIAACQSPRGATFQKSQYSTPIFIIPKKEGTVRFITDYHHQLNKKLA